MQAHAPAAIIWVRRTESNPTRRSRSPANAFGDADDGYEDQSNRVKGLRERGDQHHALKRRRDRHASPANRVRRAGVEGAQAAHTLKSWGGRDALAVTTCVNSRAAHARHTSAQRNPKATQDQTPSPGRHRIFLSLDPLTTPAESFSVCLSVSHKMDHAQPRTPHHASLSLAVFLLEFQHGIPAHTCTVHHLSLHWRP